MSESESKTSSSESGSTSESSSSTSSRHTDGSRENESSSSSYSNDSSNKSSSSSSSRHTDGLRENESSSSRYSNDSSNKSSSGSSSSDTERSSSQGNASVLKIGEQMALPQGVAVTKECVSRAMDDDTSLIATQNKNFADSICSAMASMGQTPEQDEHASASEEPVDEGSEKSKTNSETQGDEGSPAECGKDKEGESTDHQANGSGSSGSGPIASLQGLKGTLLRELNNELELLEKELDELKKGLGL